MLYVVASASSRNAIAPFSGPCRAPLVAGGGRGVIQRPGPRRTTHGHHARGRMYLGRLTTPRAGAPRAAGGLVRLPVQTWAGRSVDIMGRDQRGEAQDVNGRRACRTPLVCGLGVSPLCPSIAENHSVDERSIRGVSPVSLAGTKLSE